MWGANYGNLSAGLKASSWNAKMKFLGACIKPIAGFRWSRWPYQESAAAKLDGVQTAMISKLLNLRPLPGEQHLTFFRRRSRVCRGRAESAGRWSENWRKHVVTWQLHLERGHDGGGWAHKLMPWRGEHWLAQRRVEASRGGLSLTGTRSQSGRPAVRWHGGIKAARTRA